MSMTDVKQVDDRSLMAIERALAPLKRILTSASYASLSVDERRQTVLEKIDATKLTAKSAPSTSPTSADSSGDTKAASVKLLLSQLTKPDALDLLQQLAAYRVELGVRVKPTHISRMQSGQRETVSSLSVLRCYGIFSNIFQKTP